jgi:hypothetical protein
MTNQNSSESSQGLHRYAACLAIAGSAAFLALLTIVSFLEPQISTAWDLVSDYELGSYGWMMRLAFFCFAIYGIAMFVALRPYVQTRKGRYGLLLLLIAGVIGGVGAGIFTTDPTYAQTSTTIGDLHTLCGLTYILGFPIAATFISRDLAANSKWFAHRRWVNLVTILVWIGVAAFFLSSPPLVQGLVGYPNRYMVVIYQVWILVVAGLTWRLDKQNKGETKE